VGNNPADVTVNTPYNDAGAIATDYLNRNITPLMQTNDNVNNTQLGQYDVVYTVDDGSGNTDTKTRKVNVVDDIAPTITLVAADTIYMEVFGYYNEPGVTLTDNFYDPVTLIL